MQGGGPELSRQMASCRQASALFYSLIYPERLASSPNDTSAIGRGNRRLDRPRLSVLTRAGILGVDRVSRMFASLSHP